MLLSDVRKLLKASECVDSEKLPRCSDQGKLERGKHLLRL